MFSLAVERALRASIEAHDGQLRRGDVPVPYVVHPLHVALMLARWGMEEDEVVAGLLHDVVEDCEAWTVERVEREFGKHVASIVDELTEDKSRTWEERKRRTVENVPHLSPPAASIKAVDKLHNIQCLLADLRAAEDPASVWARFNGGRERSLTFAADLVAALERRIDPRLGRSLRRALELLLAFDAATTVEAGAPPA